MPAFLVYASVSCQVSLERHVRESGVESAACSGWAGCGSLPQSRWHCLRRTNQAQDPAQMRLEIRRQRQEMLKIRRGVGLTAQQHQRETPADMGDRVPAANA